MTDVMAQTPPILHGPSEKERKYDRQLRLWAATGQAALESASILLVNSASATVGVETLKNLVLPGTYMPSSPLPPLPRHIRYGSANNGINM
jgi:amyloid beta precursor protein binding protein 1